MKNKILIIVSASMLFTMTFGVTRNRPEDKFVIGQYAIETGRMLYNVDLKDDNGNYASNVLRVKFLGDIEGIAVNGVERWQQDPNFYLVLDAITDPLMQYDANDPNHVADPNIVTRLTGSIQFGKTWSPGHYEIGIQVFDVKDNNDCKWLILDVDDTSPPDVTGCSGQ